MEMNKNKGRFSQKLLALRISTIGDSNLSPEVIKTYWELFGDKVEKWEEILSLAIVTCDRWPSISKLYELGGKSFTPPSKSDTAKEIVDVIFGCISKWGYSNSEKAMKEIGATGWDAVMSYGGWNHLCEITDSQVGMTKAQMRGSIEAKITREGLENISLPPSVMNNNLILLFKIYCY